MITLRKIYPADCGVWARVETLYVDAFPRNERRCVNEMRRLAECGRLNVYAVVDTEAADEAANGGAPNRCEPDCGGAFRGFITSWDFGEFVYGEHFAMSPECRGAGIGGEAIDRFVADAGRPVILEVELPTDGMSRRRIGFYERHGFVVCDAEYVQPPYDTGGEGVPMRLMSHGAVLDDRMFVRVRDTLYAEVYGLYRNR